MPHHLGRRRITGGSTISRKGWALFIALCLIWGIPYMLTRIAVRELSPSVLVLCRTAPAALVLAPLALRRGQFHHILDEWRWVLAYSAVELAVPWLLLFNAQKHLTSSMAGLLIAAVPLIGALLYRSAGVTDHVDARRAVGLVIGFVGVAALVGIDVGNSDAAAMLAVLLVAVCYATGPLIISRRLSQLPSLAVIVASLAITALVYTPPALLSLPSSISGEVLAAVVTLSLVCTALAFLVFFALIQEVGPARATVVTYINPLVAVLLGVVLLGEPFTIGIAVGLPLILLGSVLGTAPSLKRRGAEETPAAAPPA